MLTMSFFTPFIQTVSFFLAMLASANALTQIIVVCANKKGKFSFIVVVFMWTIFFAALHLN